MMWLWLLPVVLAVLIYGFLWALKEAANSE